MENKRIFWISWLVGIAIVIAIFFGFKTITPETLAQFNSTIPLPIFTIVVAFIDSFNPCNLFAFLLLLGVLTQASQAKFKVYLIGLIFIAVVYAFYFLVMATWLNVFKLIGLIDPLRVAVGILAIMAGIINCKEIFFLNKGISLLIPQKQKEQLYERMRNVREVIVHGTFPLLIFTTFTLAIFTSLIELICTSGFPIIYTNILATKHALNSTDHYYYLALYNFIYIIPLLIIILAIGFFLGSKQLTKKQVGIIKFVSGIVMLVLGVILLMQPELII